MLNLKNSERILLSFIASAIILGCVVRYYKVQRERVEYLPENNFETFQKETKPVDINKAGLKDLTQLDGIGPHLAREIISYREEKGLFPNNEDIMKVKGIGPKKFGKIEKKITCKK